MEAPFELRHYFRRYTLDDAALNVQPMKLQTGKRDDGSPIVTLYAPVPILQARYKERVYVDQKATYKMTEWVDVPVVREGVDGP